jgi:hypothetical protein
MEQREERERRERHRDADQPGDNQQPEVVAGTDEFLCALRR